MVSMMSHPYLVQDKVVIPEQCNLISRNGFDGRYISRGLDWRISQIKRLVWSNLCDVRQH